MNISNQFSFLQFEDAEHSKGTQSIKVELTDRLVWQVLLPVGYTYNSLSAWDGTAYQVLSATTISDGNYLQITTTADFPAVAISRLRLRLNVGGGSELFYSQEFCVAQSIPYSNVIEYSHPESAFGFAYPTAWINKIRMPIYTRNFQPKVSSEIYRKTTGSYINIDGIQEKEYTLRVLGDEELHECLSVALLHQNITIGLFQYTRGGADYDINWADNIDGKQSVVTAEIKMLQQNYLAQQPNWN